MSQRQLQDLLSGAGTVRRIGGIAEEQAVFIREQLHRFPEDADPANAGIEKSNWECFSVSTHLG